MTIISFFGAIALTFPGYLTFTVGKEKENDFYIVLGKIIFALAAIIAILGIVHI